MDLKRMHTDFSIATQLEVDDIAQIKAAGFRSIICNRPDGEALDQPDFQVIRAAAAKQGLSAHYMPVTPGAISSDEAEDFDDLLKQVPKPILAYCRTGGRCSVLWSMTPMAQGASA